MKTLKTRFLVERRTKLELRGIKGIQIIETTHQMLTISEISVVHTGTQGNLNCFGLQRCQFSAKECAI